MLILTSEGTTGVPAGAAHLGGTGGASGTFPATTAASHSASLNPIFFTSPSCLSLALTTKRHGGQAVVPVLTQLNFTFLDGLSPK